MQITAAKQIPLRKSVSADYSVLKYMNFVINALL